jgi:hypothetical protein
MPEVKYAILRGHRPITIEARLYLNGQYQTLVENQAVVQGGPDDPDLGAPVIRFSSISSLPLQASLWKRGNAIGGSQKIH